MKILGCPSTYTSTREAGRVRLGKNSLAERWSEGVSNTLTDARSRIDLQGRPAVTHSSHGIDASQGCLAGFTRLLKRSLVSSASGRGER